MDKEGFSPAPRPADRLSLAEEQRRAFEDDRRKVPRGGLIRWSTWLLRN